MTHSQAHVFEALKQAYKAHGVTYRQAGEEIGLSESAIKKIFSFEDCSIERLAQLAAVVGMPLADLFALAERPAFQRVRLTLTQQRGLLDEPEAFAVYWKLSVELMTISQIKRLYGVGDKRCRRLLSTLDDLGLITLLPPDDRVRVVHRGLIRWVDEGPLLDHIHATWPQATLRDAKPQTPGALYRLHELHLRPAAADDLRQRLAEVLDAFLRRARFAQHTTGLEDRDAVRLVLAIAPGGFVPEIGGPSGD